MNLLSPAAVVWTIAGLCLVAPVLIVRRGRLTPFIVTVVLLAPLVGGHSMLDATEPGDSTTLLYFSGLIALVLGYSVARSATGVSVQRSDESRDYFWPISITLLFYAALTAYHFAVTGVPILSGNVEISRFDFTSSGLLGLPGRAYLYGLPIITTVAVFYAARNPSRQSRLLVAGAVSVLLLAQLASGFKGALLDFAIVIIFAVTTSSAQSTITKLSIRFLPIAGAAAAYAVAVMPGYTSYSGLTLDELINTLITRMTSAGALPGHLVMQHSPTLLQAPGNITLMDASYTLWKYVGVDLGQHFDFDQVVAASISHTGISLSSAPVTIGAFAQLVYDYGPIAALIASFVIGLLYRRLEVHAQATGRPSVYLVCVGACLGLNDYLTKGDLVYLLVNWTAMLLFTLALLTITRRVAQPREAIDYRTGARYGGPHIGPNRFDGQNASVWRAEVRADHPSGAPRA